MATLSLLYWPSEVLLSNIATGFPFQSVPPSIPPKLRSWQTTIKYLKIAPYPCPFRARYCFYFTSFTPNYPFFFLFSFISRPPPLPSCPLSLVPMTSDVTGRRKHAVVPPRGTSAVDQIAVSSTNVDDYLIMKLIDHAIRQCWSRMPLF